MLRASSPPRRAASLLLCGLLLSVGGVRADQPPGAEVFGALAMESQPALSPDGHWLAWADRKQPQARVVILDVDARKVKRILAIPERSNVQSLQWHNSETVLISLSATSASSGVARDYFNIIAQDVAGGEGRRLTTTHSYLVAARTSRPYTAIVATNPPRISVSGTAGGGSSLIEIDTRTGGTTVIKTGGEHTVGWFVDRDGRPLAREDWDWFHNEYHVYAFAGNALREILRRKDAERPILGGVLANGAALVLLESNGRGRQAAWELPLDGAPPRLLAEDPSADITSVWTDPYSGEVVGVFVSGRDESVHWLNPDAKRRYEILARAFPGRLVEPYGWNADGTRTLARVSSASSPPVFYLTDFRTHQADIAAEEYPALATVALGEVKLITYKAHDGSDIPAYLATPPGKQPLLPLVVLPHDGPQLRDFLRFDPLVQFLATRGYAVLQPQFRGSTGFGNAFRDAGFRQWGALMQDDLTDGVRALVAQGIADPRRVCIVGTTPYGGYAALAGAAFTPDLYACAVSINGLANLRAWLRAAAPNDGRIVWSYQSALMQRIGDPHDSSLDSRSPVNAVKSIKTPILIMYGANTVTSVEQSQEMARALADAGKPVTVVNLPNDVEWWKSAAARVQVFQEIDQFLRKHLQPS